MTGQKQYVSPNLGRDMNMPDSETFSDSNIDKTCQISSSEWNAQDQNCPSRFEVLW